MTKTLTAILELEGDEVGTENRDRHELGLPASALFPKTRSVGNPFAKNLHAAGRHALDQPDERRRADARQHHGADVPFELRRGA